MKRSLLVRIATSKMFLPLFGGGMALQFNLTGCDAEVRNSILSGISTSLTGLLNTVISALFSSLQSTVDPTTTTTTNTTQTVVKAVEHVIHWFA